MEELGLIDGDVCNRNGCSGIIGNIDNSGCCSCHISPPCSYCTDKEYECPECGWISNDDIVDEKYGEKVFNYQAYKTKTINDLDKTKIDWIAETHTGFTMIKNGVYPVGTDIDVVRKVVDGTFGGRFERFGNGRFKFIAYTD